MGKTKPPSTRFDVQLNEALAQDFDALATSAGVSRADIFKRAMAVYKLLKDENAKGAKIILKEEGHPDRQLIAL